MDNTREQRVIQARAAPAVSIHVRDLLDGVGNLFQARQRAHRDGGVVTRAEEVEHIALAARPARVLDYEHPPTMTLQPLSQRQSGDTCATNKCLHCVSVPFRVLRDRLAGGDSVRTSTRPNTCRTADGLRSGPRARCSRMPSRAAASTAAVVSGSACPWRSEE